MIRALLTIVTRVGPWAKDAGSEGASYSSPEVNSARPFGIICGNCAFWRPGARDGTCSIVSGSIAREGLCRLNVVPQRLLSLPATKGR